MFTVVSSVLAEKCLMMRRDSVVDAKLIAAFSSTKKQDKKRFSDEYDGH